MFKMREMHKIITTAVIFMILGCWVGQELACSQDEFCLRVPMGIDKNRAGEILARHGSSKALPQDSGGIGKSQLQNAPAAPFGSDEAVEGKGAKTSRSAKLSKPANRAMAYNIPVELQKRMQRQANFIENEFPFPFDLGKIGMPPAEWARSFLHVPAREMIIIVDRLRDIRYLDMPAEQIYEDVLRSVNNLREWLHLWANQDSARDYLLSIRRQFEGMSEETIAQLEREEGEEGLVNQHRAMKFAWDERRDGVSDAYLFLLPHIVAMRDAMEKDYPELVAVANDFAMVNGVPEERIKGPQPVPLLRFHEDMQTPSPSDTASAGSGIAHRQAMTSL